MDIYRPLKFLLFFSMLTIVSSHAAASFCSGITSTTWIANAGASDVFAEVKVPSFNSGCDSASVSVSGYLGAEGEGDQFIWSVSRYEEFPGRYSLRGYVSDQNHTGIAGGVPYTLILSNPTWSINSIKDELSGWYISAYDEVSVTLKQLDVAAPVSVIGGSERLRFGYIELQTIPLPSSVWFFGSALLGLAGVKRKK
mgnify:CR=1 FL=1